MRIAEWTKFQVSSVQCSVLSQRLEIEDLKFQKERLASTLAPPKKEDGDGQSFKCSVFGQRLEIGDLKFQKERLASTLAEPPHPNLLQTCPDIGCRGAGRRATERLQEIRASRSSALRKHGAAAPPCQGRLSASIRVNLRN